MEWKLDFFGVFGGDTELNPDTVTSFWMNKKVEGLAVTDEENILIINTFVMPCNAKHEVIQTDILDSDFIVWIGVIKLNLNHVKICPIFLISMLLCLQINLGECIYQPLEQSGQRYSTIQYCLRMGERIHLIQNHL